MNLELEKMVCMDYSGVYECFLLLLFVIICDIGSTGLT
jgi:hypothetical protein